MNQAIQIDLGQIDPGSQAAVSRGEKRRLPIVRCPVCNERAMVRTSEEITPTLRQLYYLCSNFKCSMRWRAALQVEEIISPSGVSPEFRPPHYREVKPPGHAFGQASLFDGIDVVSSAPANDPIGRRPSG
ncbi:MULTISPECIES: ogr/Delta-like zinc finger family protein [unclassified Sphingobium]|uniref:ogr/Delta-like zinc finger family protein n=1 Tax=unclassified Sphingobium TaxID=2611147 RepID=UPI00222407FC|nr:MULTISPECIES: ogr/Delta-like zinc finger family protein [unclassified Sphingobium]MCW2395152.1 hypothetical protein [Sphingobium sp. B8D3B]MCW2418666.1 hypothetical protein [Sphingobium sp. B8D3C]